MPGEMVMPKAIFKTYIRKLRFEKNEMTQQDLANLVGCTRQTIVALESGKYVPSLYLALKIARVFGVTVEEVFQFKEES
jgi:putative transcriptional regulator